MALKSQAYSRDYIYKLKATTWITRIHAFFIGVEYSCIYVSLMYYLVDMGVNSPEIYFGVILSLTSVSALLSSLLNRRFQFISSNLKRYLLMATFLSCIGNFSYSLQFSVFWLFVGRFLCGLGDSTQQVVRGKGFFFVKSSIFKRNSIKLRIPLPLSSLEYLINRKIS